MGVPDFQSVMLPLLQYAGDGEEHSHRETIEALSETFKLSQEERKELLPSGRQPIFDNRVGWAKTYLAKAGLLDTTRRGYFKISRRGRDTLKEKPRKINIRYLEKFEEFKEFRDKKSEKPADKKKIANEEPGDRTPEESLESAYQNLREELVEELLKTIKDSSFSFFEQLVVDLLIKMGYGGSRKEAGQAVGRVGDEGIDGIIKEDRLGLDIIYIQAKKWENTVSRPEIQKFAGALQGQRARKGIFITTSTFARGAVEYVSKIDSKIILIDGHRLADLMIDHNVGVSPVASYDIKQIDTDYFTG